MVFGKVDLEITKDNLNNDEAGLKELINNATDSEGLARAIGRVVDVKHAQEHLSGKIKDGNEGKALMMFAMKLNMLISKGLKRFSNKQ